MRPVPVPSCAPAITVELLRGFRLSHGPRVLHLPISTQRVVALLALQDRPVRRQYVAGLLWLDYPESSATASLRTVLWRLRRVCPELIETHAGHLSLAPGVRVDVRDAVALARALVAGDAASEHRIDVRRFGIGDLLPDWYEEWVEIERERFRQLRLHALEALCEQLTAAGSFAHAAEAGLAAVASEPLRESAHRVVIRLHLAAGNRGEAYRQLELYRRVLKSELGLAPSGAIEQLVQHGLARTA